MSGVFAVLIGSILWIPILYLLHGIPAFGTGASGWELLATMTPVLLISLPSFIRHVVNEKYKAACWVFAGSPLLALAGAGGMFTLQATLLEHMSPDPQAIAASLTVVAISGLISWLGHRVADVPTDA